MAREDRRKFLKAGAAGAAGVAAAAVPAKAATEKPTKQVIWNNGKKPEKQALFSPVVTFGDLVFISGIGAHFEGDIKSHTEHVLKEIDAKLKQAGSSMEKVLKVNVYLNDLKDYDGMNEVFLVSSDRSRVFVRPLPLPAVFPATRWLRSTVLHTNKQVM